MNYRLRTSKEAEVILKQLQGSLSLTPNILVRIAVGLSLRVPDPLEKIKFDNSGIEFNRNTLTGEFDYIFHALIAQHSEREITDEEFFPTLFQAHMERGLKIFWNEYKHVGNSEKLFRNLILS
jgi:DNA sulfur modification protein DndE